MSTPERYIASTSPPLNSSEMFESPCQMVLPTVSVSTRRVSRVNPSPLLGDAREPRMNGGSGLTSSDPFATYDPAGACWRTSLDCSQPNLDGSLGAFCGTWPRAGTMRNGTVFQRLPLVPRTSATASGLLPTPSAVDSGAYFNRSDSEGAVLRPTLGAMAKHGLWPTPNVPNGGRQPKGGMSRTGMTPDGKKRQVGLHNAVKWRTPRANDWKGGVTGAKGSKWSPSDYFLPDQVNQLTPGQLNPTWVEWLMGYPAEWTALDALEMPSSRKSRRGSCGES